MTTTVDIDLTAIKAFMQDPNGPVARYMMVVGQAVKDATIAQLHGFALTFLGPTIVKRLVMMADGPHVMVGTDRVKTEPHIIRGNPWLAFKWPNAPMPQPKGGVFFFRQVNHPGSDFTRYITERLVVALNVIPGVR